jgi:hypothetical protein
MSASRLGTRRTAGHGAVDSELGRALSPVADEAICSTIRAARTLTLMFVRWDARRSKSNASSGPHRCWVITMPLACSITGMDSSAACSSPTLASAARARCTLSRAAASAA